jgi:prophage regulatory protein
MSYKILRLPAVKESTGLSRSTIYLWIANNKFPKSISLGGRSVGWLEEDINQWLEKKIEASRES